MHEEWAVEGWTVPAEIGAVHTRTERVAKNSRWYLVRRGELAKVGWGDLATEDFDQIAQSLRDGAAFVVLPEAPPGGQHLPHIADESIEGWCWYDRPDCRLVTVDDLAASARIAVFDYQVWSVVDELPAADTDVAGAHASAHAQLRFPSKDVPDLRACLEGIFG